MFVFVFVFVFVFSNTFLRGAAPPKKLKCFSIVWWNAVTNSILTTKQMMTNIANSTTNCATSSTAAKPVETKTLTSSTTTAPAPAQSKKPRWKWSGDDEPSEYRRWDDDQDTMTLTREEVRRINGYRAMLHVKWHNADED